MATWLTRSLLFIVAGAVLAYAVTVQVDEIDLQTTGIILLLVGIFDLLLNIAITLYLRQPWDDNRYRPPTPPREEPHRTDSYATREIRRDPDWH